MREDQFRTGKLIRCQVGASHVDDRDGKAERPGFTRQRRDIRIGTEDDECWRRRTDLVEQLASPDAFGTGVWKRRTQTRASLRDGLALNGGIAQSPARFAILGDEQ